MLLSKTPLNHSWSKAANMPWDAGFCCFCLGPEETHFGQRQQICLGMQDFAASAEDPKKLTLVKGSKYALGCRILLPPPRTRRTQFGQRQQKCLWEQDFVASAEDPFKSFLVKGSKSASGSRILLLLSRTRRNSLWSKAANMPWEAGFCCFCLGPDETCQD